MSGIGKPLTIRKSCQFCRTRKIKCSGTARCEACTERNLDCVYAPESAKGRPRRISASAAARAAALMQATIQENEALDSTTSSTHSSTLNITSADIQKEASLLNSKTLESWTRIRPPASWTPENTIAQDIDLMFRQEFGGSAPPTENAYLRAIAKFPERMKDIDESKAPATLQFPDIDRAASSPRSDHSSPLGSEPMEVLYRAPVMSYDGVLTFMAQEVVEMVAIMYGRLGCQHLEDSPGKFYVKSCLADTTTKMFHSSVLDGSAAQRPSPLAKFEQHQIVQMIESWFSLHPLSGIASKTLFLRQFRDGKHDEILLNLMVGDALYIGDGRVGSNAGEPFFEHACALMGARKNDKFSLSAMQSTTLLAWHYFCVGKGRRGTAFASWAVAGTNKTLIQLNDKPITGQGMINGVDIGEVETELLKNMNCVLSLLTLWGFMQFDTPYADFLPAVPLATESLPSDRTQSKVAELDERSGNLSHRRRQSYMIKSWWALRNITSTCSHIYALYPRNIPTELEESKKDDTFWVSLHRLKGINNQNIPQLCLRIRKVLEEAVRELDAKRGCTIAYAVPTVLYYVIMVHLLFPNVAEEDDWSVTMDTMVKFLETSGLLLTALDRFEREREGQGEDKWIFSRAMLPPESTDIAMANMMLLGIDACGRALEYFVGCVDRGNWQESQVILGHRSHLREVAKALLKACKYERLNSARRLKEVKKQVKKVIASLEQWRVLDEQLSGTQDIQAAYNQNIQFSPASARSVPFGLNPGDYANAANFDFSNVDFNEIGRWPSQLPSPSPSAQLSNSTSTSGDSPEFIGSGISPRMPNIHLTNRSPPMHTMQRSLSNLSDPSSLARSTTPNANVGLQYLDANSIGLAGQGMATQNTGGNPEIPVPQINIEDLNDFSFNSMGTHFPNPTSSIWRTSSPGPGEGEGNAMERLMKRYSQG